MIKLSAYILLFRKEKQQLTTYIGLMKLVKTDENTEVRNGSVY